MKYLKLAALTTIIVLSPHAQAKTSAEQNLHETKVQAKTVIKDSVITAKIKDLFLRDPYISSLKIHVTTKNKVVYLKGEVATENEQTLAVNIAKAVDGVNRVDYSDLKLAY